MPSVRPRDAPLVTAGVFVAVLCVYARTAYPYISGGDAGELVVAACNAGVAHPPGYPLFTMLGAAAVRLVPYGAPAWRLNMLSAVLGAAAAALLHASAARLSGSAWAALPAAAGFAFSPTVWWYAVQGEVFALNNALVALLLLGTVRYFAAAAAPGGKGGRREACEGALVSGLCMANQHTTVLYTVPTAAAVCADLLRRGLLGPRMAAALVASLAAGMSPYLYLVEAAWRRAADSWGDQRSLAGFAHHFLRREYGTFQLAADQDGDPGMLVRLGVYWRNLGEESMGAAPWLAAAGAVALLAGRRGQAARAAAAVTLACYALYVGVFHYLANLDPSRPLFLGVQARFWQQINMYVFAWSAAGLAGAGAVAASLLRRLRLRLPPRGASWLGAAACVALAAVPAVRWFPARDSSDNLAFRAQALRVLASFPRDSVVLLNGDLNNNLAKYPQQCEGVRRDLDLVSLQLMTWDWFVPMQAHHYPRLVFPGSRYHPRVPGGFDMARFLAANGAGQPDAARRFFLCGEWKDGDRSTDGAFEVLPFGTCGEVVAAGSRPPDTLWARYLRDSWHALPRAADLGPWRPDKYTPDSWEAVVFRDAWRRRAYLASYIAFESNRLQGVPGLLRLARDVAAEQSDRRHDALMRAEGEAVPEHYRDAGIIFGQWSKEADAAGDAAESASAEQTMFRLWARYVALRPDDEQVAPYLREGVNPYAGRRVETRGWAADELPDAEPDPRPPHLDGDLAAAEGVPKERYWPGARGGGGGGGGPGSRQGEAGPGEKAGKKKKGKKRGKKGAVKDEL